MRFSRVGLLLLFVGGLAGLGSAQTASSSTISNDVVTPYRITKAPHAYYTKEARRNGIEGSVLLKVTLLSTGEIGDVTDVTAENGEKLEASGLTGSAIRAAKGIKFKPKRINGKPVTVVVIREYYFNIY